MRRLLLAMLVMVACVLLVLALSGRAEFMAGGAVVNLGLRLQDHLAPYDPSGTLVLEPEQIFERMLEQNLAASKVRTYFPRTVRHPLVAMVVCMDARIDSSELVGDTRRYYYVIRTAGSVLGPQEQDMLELAVENGVKLVLLTTHSECAAERVARDPALRVRYPNLARAVDERAQRDQELLQRPALATRIARGELLVRHVHIDTANAYMSQRPGPGR